jgi:hypothetical protein
MTCQRLAVKGRRRRRVRGRSSLTARGTAIPSAAQPGPSTSHRQYASRRDQPAPLSYQPATAEVSRHCALPVAIPAQSAPPGPALARARVSARLRSHAWQLRHDPPADHATRGRAVLARPEAAGREAQEAADHLPIPLPMFMLLPPTRCLGIDAKFRTTPWWPATIQPDGAAARG